MTWSENQTEKKKQRVQKYTLFLLASEGFSLHIESVVKNDSPVRERKERETKKMEMYRHYGTDRIDMNRKYTTSRGDKPAGLWASPVSCGDPWKEWCEDEDYEIEKLDRHFDFTLKPGARILHVREKEDAAPYIRSLLGGLIQELDHESLKRDFDGMEIHLSDNWSLRDMNIFYYWDVDSIVIWDLDVIEPIRG